MVYTRSNLVVLIYADNNCYTSVVLPDDPRVESSRARIDEQNGVWSAPHNSDPAKSRQTQEIGEMRYFERGSRHGVIGVYDRTDIQHLNAMVSAAQQATDSTPAYSSD